MRFVGGRLEARGTHFDERVVVAFIRRCRNEEGVMIEKPGDLAISKFETLKAVKVRQADMLQQLEQNFWLQGLGRSLHRCTAGRCGRDDCVEVCAVADWRRRMSQVPAAIKLITEVGGPVYEVRVVRGLWARPIGDLWDVSIAAAKQLNRRAFDSLFMPSLVAVGTFKVSLGPDHLPPLWVCEIHQIAAGAEKAELEPAFIKSWGRVKYDSVVGIEKVTDIAKAVNGVFQAELRGWQNPNWPDGPAASPTEAHRAEFYRWLIGLRFGERMIRYGCDRYLNQLNKQPRTINPKVYKPRPYPTWLIRHMFGNREQPIRGGNPYGLKGRTRY
jgi:hypothetical protein